MVAAAVAEHVGEVADQDAGRADFRAAGDDPGQGGVVGVDELAGRVVALRSCAVWRRNVRRPPR
jgi:hypothetical protein